MGGRNKYLSAGKPCAVHLEERVYNMLSRGSELTTSQISQRLGRQSAEVLRVLATLEVKKKVRRLSGIRAGMWGRA